MRDDVDAVETGGRRGIRVIVDPDTAGASAAVVRDFVRAEPRGVLGLATGSSPLGLYRVLGELTEAGEFDASGLRYVALDEYLGLPAGSAQSYRSVLEREALEPLRSDPARLAMPDPSAPDPAEEAARYDRSIAATGGVGLQILGIGRNGHIGFNEPPSPFDGRTRVVDLAESTRRDNSRFFDSVDEVPRRAVTQGIGTILEAKRLLLVARGSAKADAVAAALEGPIGEAMPASALRLHPDVTVVLDPEAAALLAVHGS
ncbi:glucosamine-6-phosphate deaminase [Herbiconiux sp. L3-i23]|uniref:glucosamine-6-phosphate deaminase n=1 Tax=Herbiconiux sp. L3-i23 TaxID=2905871 RepID=UPI00206EDFF1|nr:glucosamine-6-phosphate deaminase [Herbiconiux sp. L3-i23]BDI22363.1 glucosamine-6-phosphate deaminase [Herbiconiux sp. L3-i23]